MLMHSQFIAEVRNEPLGGLVAAVHKARAANPTARPLPKGYLEHSAGQPVAVETWQFREFPVREDADAPAVFLRRAHG